MSRPLGKAAVAIGTAAFVGLCTAAGYALGSGVGPTTSNRMFPWIVARATGIGAFVALTAIVLVGLLFRRPVRALVTVQRETLLRFHVVLGPGLVSLLAAHVGSLLADRYAGVGWKALVVPDGATYRPGAVTFGLIAMYLVMIVAVSAYLAGRRPIRSRWAVLHRLAYPAFVLAWVHGVLAGSDTASLRWLYILSGILVGAATVSAGLRKPLKAGVEAG
ncbi:MAG TPA: ferric reductase-like transmembrane domain-containing protein [Acidimicrobiales bacterium]|nr:ferric reductase-like transmembrane domain-containing protein [Acidimicrobiales bacterium]